jgi:hypothetical protein
MWTDNMLSVSSSPLYVSRFFESEGQAKEFSLGQGFCEADIDESVDGPLRDKVAVKGSRKNLRLKTFEVLERCYDADTFGKWLYDSSAAVFGQAAPLVEIAGDFWIMSLRLSIKTDRLLQLRQKSNAEAVEDLLFQGLAVWESYVRHIKMCSSLLAVDSVVDRGEALAILFLGSPEYLLQTEQVLQQMHVWDRMYEEAFEEVEVVHGKVVFC